jgi:hypothetical protein
MTQPSNSPELTPPAPPGPTVPGVPAHLEEGPAAAPPASKRKKWPFVVLGVVLVVVVGVVLAWGPIARSVTISQARAHGVILEEVGDIEVGWGEVTVIDYAFELEDVDGVRGQGKELTVELDGFEAESLTANEVDFELVGSAAVLAVAVSEWTGRHPELVRIPTKADDVEVSWQESSGGPVWLKIRAGTIEPLKNGAKLSADRTTVFGLPIGRVGAVWKGDEATAKLGFGKNDEDEAPILIEVENLRSEPKAKITMRPTPLLKLSGPLGMLLPIQGVMVSGDAELQYEGKRNAPIAGHVNAKLDGYTPPLPKEARGFVFGKTTTLSTDVKLDPDRTKISLDDVKVKHGPIELTGKGTIERTKSHAAIDMTLTGRVSCAALAKAALAGGLGKRIGPLVERLASGAVKGSVEVKIAIEADTRNLLKTKIDRSLGIGCGIEWPEIPEAPGGLPQIPGLPSLPGFPGAE